MEVLGSVLAAVQAVTGLATLTLTLLKESTNSEKSSTKEAQKVVKELMEFLSTFQAFLRDKQRDMARNNMSEDLVNKIKDMTLDIEDAIDEYMFSIHHHYHKTNFRKAGHELVHGYKTALSKLSSCKNEIERKIGQLGGAEYLRQSVRSAQEDGSGRSSSLQDTWTHNIRAEEDEFVDLEGHKDALVHQLKNTNVAAKRETVPVVGPGGSGKTFLAKQVYGNEQVRDMFHCHAWIHVSPDSKVEMLLLNMYQQLCPWSIGQISLGHGVGQIRDMLQRDLENKKYLVVLDNIWRKQVYDVFADALPTHSQGSRIIVTSRNKVVVSVHTSKYIHMNELNPKETWVLFCRKAFGDREGMCPEELKSTSAKIIQRCGRLPHTIALVGSMLSTKQITQVEWDRFYNSLDAGIPGSEQILKPSFEDLPDNLKSCFLYLCLLPKGFSIKRGRLIRLWIAEGFVGIETGQTLEVVAENYLKNLVDRNLVQVSEWKVDGRVSSCRVYDLFHDLGNLFKERGNLTLPNNSGPSERVRHLSVNNLPNTDLKCKKVRTLLMFWQLVETPPSSSHRPLKDKILKRLPRDSLERISERFKLLKVLDMQGTPLKCFSKDIDRLVLLKCLNMSHTQVREVPSSIKHLVFLETLNLKHTLVTNLPKEIYELLRLRYLLVSHSGKEYQGIEVSEQIESFTSLQEVSLVEVSNPTRTIENMENLKLTKLGLAGVESKIGKQLCESIQKMENLLTLDVRAKTEDGSVDLDYDMGEAVKIHQLYLKGRLKGLPVCISKLYKLVKVCLKGSKLNADVNPVEAFEDLPSLMELEMVDYYSGEELVFRAGKFRSLKILHIQEFDQLRTLGRENNAIPELQKITICKCKNLAPLTCRIWKRQTEELLVSDMSEEFISNLRSW